MFTNVNSSLSQISKNFIPNLFSGISKENSKIAVVALTIISAIATLFIICRYFKACKFESKGPVIPPHITPLEQTSKSPSKVIAVVDVAPTFSLKMDKFTSLSKNDQMSIQKLSKQQASAVLDIDLSLRTCPAMQGKMFAYNSILTIHEQGIPKLDPVSNEELMKQTQFIIYTISSTIFIVLLNPAFIIMHFL